MTKLGTVQKLILSGMCLLLMGISGSSDGIWCVGEDGHVSYELAQDGQCASDATEAEHEHDADVSLCESHIDADCCGGCVDISFFVSGSMFRPHIQTSLDLVQCQRVALIVPVSTAAIQIASPVTALQRRLVLNAHLSARRSILLRI